MFVEGMGVSRERGHGGVKLMAGWFRQKRLINPLINQNVCVCVCVCVPSQCIDNVVTRASSAKKSVCVCVCVCVSVCVCLSVCVLVCVYPESTAPRLRIMQVELLFSQ